MNHYEHTLRAIVQLLDSVAEEYWAEWLREDIRLWQADSDTGHHLGAYGGMGTFNDLFLCRENQQRVTDAQQPWVNTLLQWLKTLCYHLAQHPRQRVSVTRLLKTVGEHDAALAAFVGGKDAPASMRGRVTTERMIHGSRCFECSYAEISSRSIESAVAAALLPLMVFQACETKTLDQVVTRVLDLRIPGAKRLRRCLLSAATASEIRITDADNWMRPCPECGSNDTGAYRWNLASGRPKRLVATADNLPVRNSQGAIHGHRAAKSRAVTPRNGDDGVRRRD